MALVTYKALCIDASDVSAVQGFWARTLGYELAELDDGDAVLRGPDPGEEVWINLVPEPRTVKQRVHLDVRAESLEPFAGLEQLTAPGEFAWTTFADPEGGEMCVFTYDEPPAKRLKDVVVDSADHETISRWWADVMGGVLGHDDGYSYLDEIPGSPLESIDFVPVPEPKTVKNRIHWDVTLREGVTVDDLVGAGANVLAPAGDQQEWTVMADPEGNEFCVFPTP
ncbi:VOC family protein [Aeromicrobium yanjiei]|uniref:VOC family protein n=1 Tax=Aeromicrobium yanjiei TaxID=2662028 RepID=A0A5Q2MJN6_9ACTN|nr:VOC family protein [Aeromicrobium yanjiei]QGG40515.1 VOC family protein [Aeromicrobium yanjiei]